MSKVSVARIDHSRELGYLSRARMRCDNFPSKKQEVGLVGDVLYELTYSKRSKLMAEINFIKPWPVLRMEDNHSEKEELWLRGLKIDLKKRFNRKRFNSENNTVLVEFLKSTPDSAIIEIGKSMGG